MNSILTISEAAKLIASGATLSIAGSHRALEALPKGNWIGGSSYYFMGPDGGFSSEDKVFVTQVEGAVQSTPARYKPDQVNAIAKDSPLNGYSIVIIPSGSETVRRFAQREYSDDIFMKPAVGWIAGVDLARMATSKPCVVFGPDKSVCEDCAVVMHVTLPEGKLASLSIVNPFEGQDSPVFRFEKDGFVEEYCLINGVKQRLVEVLKANGQAEGKLPIIGCFHGANVNVSIQSIEADGTVHFYGPVYAGVDYRLAKPISDYAALFVQSLSQQDTAGVAFSCNCILNYVHGGLEGRKAGNLIGPITFGEIAYQLLNQTLVLLHIH